MTLTAPCSWPVSYEACSEDRVDDMAPAERARFEEMATTFLWNWTGHHFGVCEVALRPCRSDCTNMVPTFDGRGPGRRGWPWSPALVGGQWLTLSCVRCGSECSCGDGPAALTLPGPVASVESVTLDGVELEANVDYVVQGDRIYRHGGTWPTCQDLSQPTTAENTFEVRYSRGVAVPSGGKIAAGLLALEMWKASCGDEDCALPQRMQTITRQNVTVTLLDKFEDINEGRTGLWLVDSWIASVTKPKTVRSSVRSVDIPKDRSRVTRL